jgi:hypothetical protein
MIPLPSFKILENIKHRPGKTFRMFNKYNPLDEAHVRMVMKVLGHFHGRWLKYKFMSQAGQVSFESDTNRVTLARSPEAETLP